MNKVKKEINLPFGETLKRSFLYVILHTNLFLKVSFIGLVVLIYEMMSGFPMMCSLNSQLCLKNNVQIVSNLLTFLVSVAVIINYCRAVVLKNSPDYVSVGFLRRFSKYILVMLSLSFLILIMAVLISVLFKLIGVVEGSTIYIISVILGLFLVVCISPLFLYLGAIAVDDKTLTIKQVFTLCKGNYNKIFWGQTVLMLPGMFLMFIITTLYQLSPTDDYIGKLIYVFCLIAASLFDTCIKGSFFAHIYQYFIFYKNKQIDE